MNLGKLTATGLILLTLGCSSNVYVEKIEGKRIAITDSLVGDQQIEKFIKPFRENINKDLDSIIAYSADTYSKSDGELNTAIGNLMADIVYEQANPVFKTRTGNEIDFVLLNHGGIRSILSKGNVTKRTAYEMMPFENSIVVVELQGNEVKELIEYLLKERRAHPISHLQIIVDNDYQLISTSSKGQPIDFSKSYFVATNDYLYNGGSKMDFFKKNTDVFILDYKIRNALIDYFLKIDTLSPVIDERFIKVVK